jgi:hypothetical protein
MGRPGFDDLVRLDRVGYYHRYGAWRYFPQQGPTYGDLWLTYDGRVGFIGVGGLMNTDAWEAELANIGRVSPATNSIRLWTAGALPCTSFEADVNDKSEMISWLGIKVFLSEGDKWVARIPGVHGAGDVAVQMKSLYQNRGARARAEQACKDWLAILDRSVDAAQLPRLKDVTPGEV